MTTLSSENTGALKGNTEGLLEGLYYSLLLPHQQRWDGLFLPKYNKIQTKAKSLGQSIKPMTVGGDSCAYYLMILFCPKAPRPGQAGRLLVSWCCLLGGRHRIPAEMISPCSDWIDLATHSSALFWGLVIPIAKESFPDPCHHNHCGLRIVIS